MSLLVKGVLYVVSLFAVSQLLHQQLDTQQDAGERAGVRDVSSLTAVYPGPWVKTSDEGIANSLLANRMSDCRRIVHRENASHHGEHLVYCQKTSGVWDAYVVWPESQKVIGPFKSSKRLLQDL